MRYKLNVVKTTKDTHYYLATTTKINGKSRTTNIKKLGTNNTCPMSDPKEYYKGIVDKHNTQSDQTVYTTTSNTSIIQSDSEDSCKKGLNVGHLYLKAIYDSLKLKDWFKSLNKKNVFDANTILEYLVYARIIEPNSKNGSCEDIKNYYNVPDIKLHNIYRTLDIIADNLDSFQKYIYKRSACLVKRDLSVLYYDTTNYYFEINIEDNLRRYGKEKNNRPDPIVQMGLFMDGTSVPLAFQINPGNTSDQAGVISLEKMIVDDFKVSEFIYVSDAGCNSNDIRLYNTFDNRNYIVTQSIKKLKQEDKELVFKDDGWYYYDSKLKPHPILRSELKDDDDRVIYKTFYVNNKINIGVVEIIGNRIIKKTDFLQRLIVSYSKKYERYQRSMRLSQLQKAYELAKHPESVSSTSAKRFIKVAHLTNDNEYATHEIRSIDIDLLNDEMLYDGLYGVVTSLEDMHPTKIKSICKRRWLIEDSFKIMKSEFKSRPVFHSKDTRIKAHFAVCFLSLIVYRIMENKLGNKYDITDILNTLRHMEVITSNEVIYDTTYKVTKLINDLDSVFNKSLSRNSLTRKILHNNFKN